MKMLIRVASAIALFAGSYAMAAQEITLPPVPQHPSLVMDTAAPAVLTQAIPQQIAAILAPASGEERKSDDGHEGSQGTDPHEDMVAAPAPVDEQSPLPDTAAPPPEAPVTMATMDKRPAAPPVTADEPPLPSPSETITIPTAKTGSTMPNMIESPVERGNTEAAPAEVAPPSSPRSAQTAGGLPEQRYANPVLVTTVQEKLTALGYYHGPVDGLIGDQIRTAIKAFQRANNMTPNGWVTTYLLAEIERTSEKPLEQHAPPVEMPTITPPPPPIISTWSTNDLLGKMAHAASGDRLGPVQDALIGTDGQVVQTYIHVNTLYGDPNGTSSVPWDDMNHNMALPSIITKLGGVKASKIREMPIETPAEPGQWRISAALNAPVSFDQEQAGQVKDMIFDQNGKVQRFIIAASDESCRMDVPVEHLSMDWQARKLDIARTYVDECLKTLFPDKTAFIEGRPVQYKNQLIGTIRQINLNEERHVHTLMIAGREERCHFTLPKSVLSMDWDRGVLSLSDDSTDSCLESLFHPSDQPIPLSTKQ